ncbi:MAG TPA: hypothetical protein VGQ08_05895 [Nitrospiraceae bacterium]|jgi:hypothetical protein|nr:hypothetical protein [Nitrospiraceae bacterium]
MHIQEIPTGHAQAYLNQSDRNALSNRDQGRKKRHPDPQGRYGPDLIHSDLARSRLLKDDSPIDVGRKPRIVGNDNDRHGNVEESRHHGQERACQEIACAEPVRMLGEKRVFAVSE